MKKSINKNDLLRLMKLTNKLIIIDVRSKDEFMQKHLPFAGNLPIEFIEQGVFVPEPKKTIITICGKGGGRSEKAAEFFRERFKNDVFFLEGGTFGWYE